MGISCTAHPSRLSSTAASGAGEAGPQMSTVNWSPPCSRALPLASTAAHQRSSI